MPKVISDQISGLRPYQKTGVKFLIREGRALLCDEMGLGKSLGEYEPVMTTNGWVSIKNLAIGDRVIAIDGRQCTVAGVFPQGERELVRVHFSDGAYVDCDWDHLWEVNTATREHRGCEGLVKTTKELFSDRLTYDHGGYRWRVPLVLPIKFSAYPEYENFNPVVEPYLLGVLLGDGYLSGGGTSIGLCTDKAIIDALEWPSDARPGTVVCTHPDALYNATVRVSGMRDHVMDMGLHGHLAHQKFVPQRYLFGPIHARVALLQGLFDTDGTPITARGNPCTSVEYGTVSKQLALDVQFLVESLGGIATIVEKVPTYQGGEGRLYYRMVIRLPSRMIPFRLQRKLGKWTPRRREPVRCITSIEPIGMGQAVCIRVDHPRQLFLTRRFVATHNSAQLIGAARGKTLIIAPANVINTGTWKKEVAKWATDPTQFTQCAYTNVSLREGSIPTLDLNPALDQHWDTVILDESHYIKNAKTKRTGVIRQIVKKADRLYMATGTPIPNWPHEVFTSLQMIFPEKAKPGGYLGSRDRWIAEWFKTSPSKFSAFSYDIHGLLRCTPQCDNRNPLDPCDHYKDFVSMNFRGKFLQRMRDDVLPDLPPLTEELIEVPFTAKQEAEYKRMTKDYLATVDDEEIIAWSDGAKNTMLDRITTGLGLIASPFSIKESGKLAQLQDDLSERYRPTLVVAHYRTSVEACARIARDLGRTVRVMHGGTPTKEREELVDDFQAGQVDVLCGSIETLAEGLTLTAADMTIMVEYSWKPHRNQQVIRRIHRLGQTRPCMVKYYEAKTRRGGGTLDTHKRKVVMDKTVIQTRVLTAARFKQMLTEG